MEPGEPESEKSDYGDQGSFDYGRKDAILYYVNKDIPVLASMNDGNAVLIIGFNELNTVLMDPLTGGTPFKKGMNDSTQMFAENGNRFITYMKE